MSLSSRSRRRSALCLLGLLSASCLAQKPQFSVPLVQITGGRVTGVIAADTQNSGLTDILYVNAPTVSASVQQITVSELLNVYHAGYEILGQNQITFSNVSSVVPTLADFNGDGILDYAFATTPTVSGAAYLCVYYGIIAGTGGSIFNGGNTDPPAGQSGCTAFPLKGTAPPIFSYIAAIPFTKGGLPQILIEDSANNYLYVLANSGGTGSNGALPNFTLKASYAIPSTDGTGPIFTSTCGVTSSTAQTCTPLDLNGDGYPDFVVNNQTSHVASVYLGNGDGTFQPPVRYAFDHNVHSMLLQDMDGDGHPDLIAEGDKGVIEIFPGNSDGTFASTSIGGTTAGLDGFSGNGGHLVAVADLSGNGSLDILTTTPIGLSVLLAPPGTLTYTLGGIYNIGPGRSSFALQDLNNSGAYTLAVDSPEGVALIPANPDGTFQTSRAYPALAPALGASVAQFTASGYPDVIVATGTVQSQLLTGNGDGTFTTFPAPANTSGFPSAIPSNLWSAVLTGDFDGDGHQDLLYSLTGLPLPTPGPNAGTGLYLQYGNGDGTFQTPVAITNQLVGASSTNNFYGESAVADLNGDGIDDIANIDTLYYDTLLSQKTAGAFVLGLNYAEDGGSSDFGDLDSFSQVAAGFFKTGRTNQQDLVFQDDADITPYRNTGAGTSFTSMKALANPPSVNSLYGGTILIADIDGDGNGNGDIIVPYHNLASDPANPSPSTPNQLYIWYGNGDGTFSDPQIIPLSRNYYLAQIVDMNGDGLPDIVLSDGYIVSILYNLGNRTFGDEQHFLAGQGINSLSVADVNGDGALDLILSNGGDTISDAVAIGGKTLNSITLTPNPDVNTGGITVLLNQILTKPVTGTLTSSPNPSTYGAGFTITAALTPSAGVATPTGTVAFSIDGTYVGTGNVNPTSTPTTSSAAATWTVPAGNTYAIGNNALTAMYSGDAVNSTLPLNATQVVQGSPTTTTLYLCIGPTPVCPSSGYVMPPFSPTLFMSYGQTFNGTTVVTPTSGNSSSLTGNVLFYDNYNGINFLLCTLKAASGQACPPSVGTTQGTSVGTNVFTAVYTGDPINAGSTSATVTINVLQDTTSAALTSSLSPAPFGQPVTFTATLTGNAASPTGTVVFTYGATTLGTGTLTPVANTFNSTATVVTSTLPVGSDGIVAAYGGTVDFAAASATFTQVITPVIATTTTLTSSIHPSVLGQSVTFTATVATAAGTPIPTGTVTFTQGTTLLGTATLSSTGTAQYTTSTLPLGPNTITASASGDSATGPSSATITQTVLAQPAPGSTNFTITVTPTPVSVGVGLGTLLTVTVTPLNGFPEAVNLTCANLPTETTCSFQNATIPVGGGSTSLFLNTTAPHTCGTTQPYFLGGIAPGGPAGGIAPFAVPALAGLVMLFVPGKRRWLRSLVAIASVACAMQITGCSTCTDLGTRPATYTIRVTGASAGTSEVESAPVTLNVTL